MTVTQSSLLCVLVRPDIGAPVKLKRAGEQGDHSCSETVTSRSPVYLSPIVASIARFPIIFRIVVVIDACHMHEGRHLLVVLAIDKLAIVEHCPVPIVNIRSVVIEVVAQTVYAIAREDTENISLVFGEFYKKLALII